MHDLQYTTERGSTMVFSNLFFLYLFFPICFISYFATKNATRNTVLILFSLLFYAWGEPVFLWLLLLSSVINFAIGKGKVGS